MQTKFKYSGTPNIHKNINMHPQKNPTLPYINLLDKCTQILREDRIWIRNQLKASDPEVIAIFKQAKKPINMQHLQIRLRKFISSIKSKAKMEQLMKFKQNMNLGQWHDRSHDKIQEKFNHSMHGRDTFNNYSHSHMPSKSMHNYRMNQSTENRGHKTKVNSSIEKPQKAMIYPYRNSSVNHSNSRKAFDYPAMQEITERESQNVTSARNRIKGQNDENNDGMSFGLNYTYQQWKRPQNAPNPLQSFKRQINDLSQVHHNNFNISNDNQEEQSQEFCRKRMLEKSPQRQIYEHYHQEQSFTKPKQTFTEKINDAIGATSPKNTLHHFDNNFILPQQHQNHYQSHQSHQSHHYRAQQPSNNFQSSKTTNLMNDLSGTSSFNQFPNPLLETTKINNISRNDDDIFTSPQLLQQCRNFIKNKSSMKNTIQKKQDFKFDHGHTYQPLNFDHTSNNDFHDFQHPHQPIQELHDLPSDNISEPHPINQFQNTMKSPFSNVNCGLIESVKIPDPICHDEPQQQMPSHYRQENKELKHPQDFGKTYEFFQTFANQSSKKKQVGVEKIENAEKFVDSVLNNVTEEIEGYIQWYKVVGIVQRKCPQFKDAFIEYLEPEQGQSNILISNIGRVMEDLLQNENQTENQVRNVYRLFDIENKGYIVQQDLSDFILHLQEAQADDVEIIAKQLWKLFESIDEDSQQANQKRIDYWGIYARKNSQYFIDLNELLKQFQFQIQ